MSSPSSAILYNRMMICMSSARTPVMQKEYWKKQLKDAPRAPHIPMPSDFDRPITDDSLGDDIMVSVPADLVKSLKSLAIACGTTLFVTVLGAWMVSTHSNLQISGLIM